MERRTQCGAMRFPASTRRKQAAMRCEMCVDEVADAGMQKSSGIFWLGSPPKIQQQQQRYVAATVVVAVAGAAAVAGQTKKSVKRLKRAARTPRSVASCCFTLL